MAKMSAKDKRMADMKRRFQKTSPSKNIGQSISQRLLNDIFGKSKAMGVDSDPKGMMSLKKDKKDKLVATGTKGVERPKKKGKVDPGLQKALKNKKKSSTTGNVSQGSTMAKKKVGSSTKTKTGGKVKATAANTKNYASTLAMQKRLKKLLSQELVEVVQLLSNSLE